MDVSSSCAVGKRMAPLSFSYSTAWVPIAAGLSTWAMRWPHTASLSTPWTIVDLAAQEAYRATSMTIIPTWKISASSLPKSASDILEPQSPYSDTAWEVFLQHTLLQNMGICSPASFSSIHGYKTLHISLYQPHW